MSATAPEDEIAKKGSAIELRLLAIEQFLQQSEDQGKEQRLRRASWWLLIARHEKQKKIDEDQHVTKPEKDLWEDWSVCTHILIILVSSVFLFQI